VQRRLIERRRNSTLSPDRRAGHGNFSHAMTRRAPDDRLFLPEGEIAARVGLSSLQWQAVAAALEKGGLPTRDPLFDNCRYWPAVRAFLDRRAGLVHNPSPLSRDGEENWDDDRGRKSRART
jgi:hypothetical protein